MRTDKHKELDLLIDQVLRDFPLEPAPGHLKVNIMDQIQKPLAAPRFRISWVDLALSGVTAVIFGFALDLIQGVARSPYWNNRLQVAFSLFWQDMRYFLLQNQSSLIAVLLSAGVVLSLLAVLASVYWRYIVSSSRVPA